MVIYTSYFAKAKSIPDGYCTISIAASTPKWYYGAIMPDLAPPYALVRKYKQDGDEASYTAAFKKQVLSKLNPVVTVARIMSVGGGRKPVLLCYEKSGEFCHRHLIAEWLRENNIKCEELTL